MPYEKTQSAGPGKIRFGAMLAGVLLCLFISMGLPYGEFVIQGTRLGLSSSTPAAFFLLFVLVAIVHPLLGLVRRSWAFTRAELLLVTVMMMLATAIPSRGFSGMMLAMITGAPYYASAENNWEEILLPHIPSWIIPQDREAIKNFYEGLPHSQPIPWDTWIEPLGWWLLFMAAFYLVLFCSMVILRRQWMDHERLLYPLAQVPLSMIEDQGSAQRLKPFLRNPVMWAGFAVPFAINTVNAFSHYYPSVQPILLQTDIPVVHDTVDVRVRLNFLMMGLAYFINTGVSFSLWFFVLLAKCQEAVCSILGIYSAEQLDSFSHIGAVTGMLSHQTMGAMIVLVVAGLWIARPHLREVWRQARAGRADGEELFSYRAAVLGLAAGLAVMAIWLWRAGLPAWAVALYMFGAFTIFLALTRVIVEAGLSSAVQGMTACGFVVSGVGSTVLGPSGMAAIAHTLAWAGDLLVFMMAPCANGLRMLHEVRANRRRILLMLAVALVIGLLGSLYATLKLGYQYGALNLHRQYFSWFAQMPFNFAGRLIENPSGPHWPGWGWTGLGAGFMGLLMLARHYLLWWPLHPVGFVVSGTWIMDNVWFSIFLAWMIKAIVLKYAGPGGYRTTRWFFLGIILGQFVVGGLWLVIDGFTDMKGNRIRMY